MFMIETKKIPVNCSSMSLVGIGRKRPCSWGNYFWMLDGKDEIRILNMWWENLKSLTEPHNEYLIPPLNDYQVEVRIYTEPKTRKKWGLIVDERVPKDYLYNKLCFTGGTLPPIDIAKDMYDVIGDPDYEFERFIDTASYYRKRGGHYCPETGIVTYDLRKETKK